MIGAHPKQKSGAPNGRLLVVLEKFAEKRASDQPGYPAAQVELDTYPRDLRQHRSRVGITREFSVQNAGQQPARQADDARATERTGHLCGLADTEKIVFVCRSPAWDITLLSMQKPTVAFSPCQGYGPELAKALETLLAHLGGWQTWIKPGQQVLIKPNLLGDLAPERAATTHPELVRHVIRSLLRYGAQVQVGDSPANAMDLQRVWQVTGMAKVCAEEKVPLIGFEQHATRQVSHGGHTFSIAEAVMSADLIVNLPKIKSHGLTTLTAAVKNFYGVLPGYQKTQLHAIYPRPERFCRMLRSLHAILPPSISIADGVVGMEGDGPSNGQPVQLGFLAASADAVALDLAICQVLGIDPARVPFLTDSSETLKSVPAFDWLGDAPSAPLPFRAPSGGGHILRLVPAPFLRLLKALVWIRPSFTPKCRACGRCVVACPVQALNQAKGKIPKLRARRCIACCCCHEVCPAHAIRMRRSLLLRTFGVFRNLDA